MKREWALVCVHVDEVELFIFGAALSRFLSQALIVVRELLFKLLALCEEVLLGLNNTAYCLDVGVRFLLGQQTVEIFQERSVVAGAPDFMAIESSCLSLLDSSVKLWLISIHVLQQILLCME